jgi:uncharacterized protein (DUF2336 family)
MIEYQHAKALAADGDPEARRRLAERADVQPEILYFLAEDRDAVVRAAIAANLRTPRHADLILAKDSDESVRERLAHKIARLAPDLSKVEHAQIRDLTYELLAILSADRTKRVRQIVAEAIRELTDAPVDIIRALARDVEIEVAGPILEHSPLLSDVELIEIITSKPIQGALASIGRRRRMGMKLSDALVAAAIAAPDGALMVAALLKNNDAEIGDETMARILDLAPERGDWHEPLVQRPVLPASMLRRLAGFVSKALCAALVRRAASDPATAAAIAQTVERRLHMEGFAAEEDKQEIAPADLPRGDAAISAAIKGGEMSAVAGALARDSGFAAPSVRRVLASGNAKAIVALAWKAGYPVSLAVALQKDPGKIPASQVLQPGDGPRGYPLDDAELEWQLDLIQVPSARISRQIDPAPADQ